MFGDDIVVRARLMPPRLPRRSLRRPRLDQLIANAAEYPVTVIHSSAGYGKTNALATFAATGGWPTIWATLSSDDADPVVFLVQLIAACRTVAPTAGRSALERLERKSHTTEDWNRALDALLNDLVIALGDDTILVLDDYYLVDDAPVIQALVERLIVQRPPRLHLVLGTRQWPQITILPLLQVRQEVCEIGETDLQFTAAEIALLFHDVYHHALTQVEAHRLAAQTGGWIIALQLWWQSALASSLAAPAALVTPPEPPVTDQSNLPAEVRDLLFVYLAQDVLARQPADVQIFLLRSSVLLELDAAACDAVLSTVDSSAMLHMLNRRGLFLTPLGTDVYRYQPLFHAFLSQRAATTCADWLDLHRRAAAYYRVAGIGEKVLYHLLQLADLPAVAAELEQWAPSWLRSGRFTTLLDWLDRLPAADLAAHPQLLQAQGDAARLLARFTVALHAYQTLEKIAETQGDLRGQVRALEGQALIYLDTVEPAVADLLLRHAYKLLPVADRRARADLVRLMAENRLNRGRADQAIRLHRLADRLDPKAHAYVPEPRIYLRLGQLDLARQQLLIELAKEQATTLDRQPEAHREVTVLLALLSALEGDGVGALSYAQQALNTAQRLGSSLFEAVAHIRLGHALQLVPVPDLTAANRHYVEAMALADGFGIQRTKAEAYIGLALLHGFAGNLPAARAAGYAGLELADKSGDAWTAALLWTTLGAVGVIGGAAEAPHWLGTARLHYERCHDTYGQTIVQLWLSIWYQRSGRLVEATQHAYQTLALMLAHGYTGLFAAPSLFGPRDRLMLVPLLLAGRSDRRYAARSQALLVQYFPALAADRAVERYHPGVTLRIQTLGRLQIMRGNEEVPTHLWQRKKAPQLLALLLNEREHWLQREQICDRLWPDSNADDAEAQFKVTLNALQSVLEPTRPPRTAPCYVRREGAAYRFLPSDGVWLDVVEFEARIDAGLSLLASTTPNDRLQAQQELSAAVGLYSGDYLSEYLYDEWLQTERERLAMRYLQAATALAELWLSDGRLADAAQLCDLMLVHDPGWENAYQLLMRIYEREGNRRQALATYERCVRNLRTQLDVAPLPETTRLYERIKR